MKDPCDERQGSLMGSMPSFSLVSKQYRREVFFVYEKRLRNFSPPEVRAVRCKLYPGLDSAPLVFKTFTT